MPCVKLLRPLLKEKGGLAEVIMKIPKQYMKR